MVYRSAVEPRLLTQASISQCMIYLSCEMVLLASFDTVGSKHLKNHVITRSHCALRAMVARGTKKKPLCAQCAGKGHYTSTCPVLAAAALKALAKTTDLKKLETQLRNGQPVRLQKLGKKRRTLKKASGKRGFSEAFKVSSKKDQRSAKPKIRHKKKEKDRKPRAKKQDSSMMVSSPGLRSRPTKNSWPLSGSGNLGNVHAVVTSRMFHGRHASCAVTGAFLCAAQTAKVSWCVSNLF